MTGGLGNQMFIYAFYLRMKRQYADTRIDLSDMVHYQAHNGYELHRIFPDLPQDEFCINQKAKKVIEFLFFKTILERHQRQDSLTPFFGRRLWPLVYFKGFYQSERFFADIADDVRRAFTFRPELACEKTRRLLAVIDADPTAVSIHVRRGDYLQPSVWRNTGCVCNATYVDWNHAQDSWQDMMLMSHCRHNIICNSTFSWWGAWLNRHPDKVVAAPGRWSALAEMPNICPADWLRIPVSPDVGQPAPKA